MRKLQLGLVLVAATACSDVATQPTSRTLRPTAPEFNALSNVCSAPEQARLNMLKAAIRSLHLGKSAETTVLNTIDELGLTGRDLSDYLGKILAEQNVDANAILAMMAAGSCVTG